MPITHYVHVLGLDEVGSVFTINLTSGTDLRMSLGESFPLGTELDVELAPAKAREIATKICVSASEPEFLEVVTFEGKQHHVYLVRCERNMQAAGSMGRHKFTWRWFIEEHIEEFTPLEQKLWGLIHNRSYELPPFQRSVERRT